jgi:hypothetical protein
MVIVWTQLSLLDYFYAEESDNTVRIASGVGASIGKCPYMFTVI